MSKDDIPLPSAVSNLRDISRSNSRSRSVTFSIHDGDNSNNDDNENAVADSDLDDDGINDNVEGGRKRYRRSLRFEDSIDHRDNDNNNCFGKPEKVNADLEIQANDNDNRCDNYDEFQKENRANYFNRFLKSKYIKWTYEKFSWQNLRPVIRASLSTWIGLVLFLITPVLKLLGQAGFYILVCGFLASPRDAIVPDIERQLINLIFVCSAWAWTVIGLAIGFAARDDEKTQSIMSTIMEESSALSQADQSTYLQKQIVEGRFIQPSTSVVSAIFLSVGCGFFLYLKSQLSPPRFGVACVFSSILLIVAFTQGHQYPYPNYQIGKLFALPLAIQSAINILCSIFVLPVTVNHQFLIGLRAVLTPLEKFVQAETDMLGIPVTSEDWIERVKFLKTLNSQSVQAMIAVRSKRTYIDREYSFGLLRGRDCQELFESIRLVHLRSGGFLTFCEALLVAFHNKHLLQEAITISDPKEITQSTAASIYNPSNQNSPYSSKPGTPRTSSVNLSRHDTQDSRDNESKLSNLALFGSHSIGTLTEKLSKRKYVAPIGVFESQRYMDLEQQLKFTDQEFIRAHFKVVNKASKDLNETALDTLYYIHNQIDRIDNVRIFSWIFNKKNSPGQEKDTIVENLEKCDNLKRAIDKFTNEDRLLVLKNYEKFFDGSQPKAKIPYRALFWSFSYQYHLLSFSKAMLEVVEKISNLEAKRKKPRLWIPEVHLFGWFSASRRKDIDDGDADDDDDDPEHMPDSFEIFPQSRDPDVLPPSNIVERFGSVLWKILLCITSRQALFAVKTGVLVSLVTLPSYLKSSSGFFYYQRGIWVAIMSCLATGMHRGDTIFNWFTRIIYSVVGIFGGLLIWSIAAQKGISNSYAVAATCAVAFPIVFYIVMYYPGTSVGMMVLMVSVAMVLGYSWQDSHNPNLVNIGWGWDLAWRRLVLVLIGVTAAFVFAYVPPISSAKRHQRLAYSKTITSLANMVCLIIGYSISEDRSVEEEEKITKSLLAIKAKLRKCGARQDFAAFEFSLRGKWPRARYQALLNCQLDLVELLSQFMSIVKQLDPLWTHCVMRRIKFLDHRFVGEVLAVFEMCATSIKTGMPLPQITPCPLVDRGYSAKLGVELSNKTEEIPHGLPTHIDFNVLQSQEYWLYCVAYSTSVSILIRIDRLMLYTKSLVGEQFHIQFDNQV